MATSKSFCNFVLEQLNDLGEVTYRPMMGEYLLYYHGVLFGGLYDNRLLVKITNTNAMFGLREVVPYEHAKAMFMIDDLDDQMVLKKIILTTVEGLKR